MVYSQKLRKLFPEISLHAEDLLLLETFQILYLPDRVAPAEFATLLREYPVVQRFLVAKHPRISTFLTGLLSEHKAVTSCLKKKEYCQEALWEIADQIIYNKYPELFDQKTQIHWDISVISSITPLEGKTVADVGAGSGRIAFLVAPYAQTVFAVEPIGSFRSFMKKKAAEQKVNNIFVQDGTLDSIPLPDDSLDVLITSNAIGWNLDEELKEIERVVRPGGHVIHLLQSEAQHEDHLKDPMTSAPWKYEHTRDSTGEKLKIVYFKKCL